ncbi:MAG: type I secretion C-terminal target domain-containing protein, partial [Microcystis aeruginosa S11-01]|nr:type I secretion C-terminal target domain-containing protein [Microcystis aeruginosa S11-05]NCR48874.1 type I secretion C-terminal target domain-containing protein [Microcystis aeruginosa S11-01]
MVENLELLTSNSSLLLGTVVPLADELNPSGQLAIPFPNPNLALAPVTINITPLISQPYQQAPLTISNSPTNLTTEPPINQIVGTPGRDNLIGTDGRDRITGGQGADNLTGRLGADIFVYESLRDAGDTIKDFTIGEDKIDLTVVLESVEYNKFDPLGDGYIYLSPYSGGTIVLLDSDGKGNLTARPYIYVQPVTPAQLTAFDFLPNPGKAPEITANLVNDTGISNSDRLTYDPTIQGQISYSSPLTSVKAQLNSSAVEILSLIQADGKFLLTTAQLTEINAGTLPDGNYSLKLTAQDNKGNISAIYSYDFSLDRLAPNLSLNLATNFDSEPVGDLKTTFETVILVGTTEANLTVRLGGLEATANGLGEFSFSNQLLNLGNNNLSVSATDLAGNVETFSQNIERLPLVVNQAPTELILSKDTIAENSGNNFLIGTLSTLDPDVGDSHNYSLVTGQGDTDNSAFTIVGNELRIKNSADFETKSSYSIRLRTTDVGGLSYEQTFTVKISNVNEAPILNPIGNKTIKTGNTLSFIVTATDEDIPPNTLTFQLDNNAPLGATINPTTGQFIWTPTTVGTFSVTIRIQDNGTPVLEDFETISIQVNAVNLRPTDLSLNPATIAENVAVNTVVGQLNTIDPDFGDTFTYQLVSGGGDTNNNLFQIIDDKLAVKFSPDFETKNQYSIRFRTTDNGGLSLEKALTISILDVNEAPTDITLSPATVAENSLQNTPIGILNTVDTDFPANSFSYSLVNDAGGRFAILPNTNQLIVAQESLLDFETTTSHIIRVKTTDISDPNLSYEKDLNITVTNINEAPFFTSKFVNNAEVGTVYRYNITTDDSESDRRTLTATNLPNWLTLVDNGNGTASLSGTPTVNDLGITQFDLIVQDAGGLTATQTILITTSATLREGNNFSPQLTKPLTIPTQNSVLSFNIEELYFDTTDLDSINDAFEVALLDNKGNSLVYTIASGKDAFFNQTEGEPNALAAGVSIAGTTLRLNLSGIATGTPANLVFRLINNDQDTTSYVRINQLEIVPDGGTPILGVTPTVTASRTNNQIDFTRLSDVSSSTQADYGQTAFNQATRILSAELAIKNIGTYWLESPLIVAVKNLSNPNVQVFNADGTTPEGLSYFDLSNLVNNGKLEPGQITETKTITFKNPDGTQFTYELVILSELNANPVIQTQPVLEIIGGQKYIYDLDATDADLDTLTYSLLVAPNGMIINPNTGLIEWNTTPSNLGNQTVTIQVSDGRGGTAQQNYTLSVIETPPNRPPIFTSNPVVDAYIKKLYQYDANAIDPDRDALTYSLIIGPNGITINPDTGLVQWTPPPALILGDTVLGRITIPGERDEFTFGGVAGQRIYIDPLQYSSSYNNWSFDVYSPSGVQIVNDDLDGGILFNLTEDGNYRIVVNMSDDLTGSYGFSIIDTALAPVANFDTVITSNLAPGSEDDVYTFRVAEGRKLYFDALSKDGTLGWVLYGQNNQAIASNNDFNDFEFDLSVSGDYTLVVYGRDSFTKTVNYSFKIITPDLITQAMVLNTNVSGSLSEKGEYDTYTFTGTAGQQLFYDALGGDYLKLRFFDPTGREIFNVDSRYDRAPHDGLTLALNGTYRVVIDGERDGIGNYKFRLLDKANATVVNLDTDITGTFD